MNRHSSARFRVSAMLLLFFAAAFLLHASRAGNSQLYLLAAAVPGAMLLLLLFPGGTFFLDRPSLSAALSLCGFGILAPASLFPEDALSQGMRCIAGLFFLMAGAVWVRSFRPSLLPASLTALCGLGMLSCPMWLPDLPFTLTSGGMVLLLLGMVAFLSLRLRLPALTAAAAGLLLLLMQKDFASAAIWGLMAVLVFWASSGSALWSGICLVVTAALFGGFLGFQPQAAMQDLPSRLSVLAAMPLLPPEAVPDSSSAGVDSLFFLLGEQYGLIFLLCAVLLLILLLIRGTSLALHTRKSFHASLSLGIVLLLGLQGLLFLGSATDLLPLAPRVFPFMTASMPDLFAQFFMLGLWSGVSGRNESDLNEDARLAMLAR